MSEPAAVVLARGVEKRFHEGALYMHVLNGIYLCVAHVETVFIVGSSGSG